MAFEAVRILVSQGDQSRGLCGEVGLRLPRQEGGPGAQPFPGGGGGRVGPGWSKRLSILVSGRKELVVRCTREIRRA